LQQQYVLPASNVVESNFIESSRDQIAAEEFEISDNNATPSSPMVVEEGVSQSHHCDNIRVYSYISVFGYFE
jgi:hypothetical protein